MDLQGSGKSEDWSESLWKLTSSRSTRVSRVEMIVVDGCPIIHDEIVMGGEGQRCAGTQKLGELGPATSRASLGLMQKAAKC